MSPGLQGAWRLASWSEIRPVLAVLNTEELACLNLARAQGARRGLVKSRSERAPGPALAGVTSCQTLGNDDMDGTDFVVPPVRQSYSSPAGAMDVG